MHFLRLNISVRLWWERQIFRLRKLPIVYRILILLSILCVILFVPNPFASQYKQLPLNQNVQWKNIEELYKIKNQVCLFVLRI